MENPELIEFYGKECLHCIRMEHIVKNFEKKHKIKLVKFEVWHDEKNEKILRGIPEFRKCNGVPFFFNKENNKFICGECEPEELERLVE